MDIVLNQIAIWRPCGAKELNVRTSPAGQRYRMPGGAVYRQSTKPLYRFAKDYEVDDIGFCLFVRTEGNDPELVEKSLDYYAKKVTKEQALKASANGDSNSFEYLPYLYEAKNLVEEDK